MNYHLHYNNLINRARLRVLECYAEKHHIVPRCLNGTDDPANLVNLTPEEHYVAHQLLIKMYPGVPGLVFAAHMMGATRKGNKVYGWLRRKYSEEKSKSLKGKPPNNKGKKLSPERIEQIRISSTGRKHTDETKAQMSAKKIGNKNGINSPGNTGMKHSEEHRRKISEAGKGRIMSEDTKKKLSEQRKGILKPKSECPYCGCLFSPTNMVRYHGDKCKSK